MAIVAGATALATAWSAPALAASALGAHAHGVATLQVVVDGSQLQVLLETPLNNLLGFEHAPRNETQRAAIRTMAGRLRQAATLFLPTAQARCRLTAVQLVSAVLGAELLGGPGPAASATSPGPTTHADLDATFTFACAVPTQLKGMELSLMEAFPGLRKLGVSVVGPRGQSATTLVPGKRGLSW